MNISTFESTNRVKKLKEALYTQGKKDRSSEWFSRSDFDNIAKLHSDKTVIIRRAYAIKEMLSKMTDKTVSERTLTYNINDDELIVGVLPMGSNGLGKVFPLYLTEDEQRMGSITNRDEFSLLGHNTVNYDTLLDKGLNGLIKEAKEKIDHLSNQSDSEIEDDERQNKIDFYHSVIISLKAVRDYANKFADLAGEKAKELDKPEDKKRRDKLLEIERICRKVPMNKPESFHEALQSIYTFHVALHASMNYISLGRLDQVLVNYLDKNRINDENYINECIELFECFIIKAAWRLNLTTEYLVEQDHIDHYASLGIHPYYLDQRAGVNNFLQNIIVGGKNPDGEDATNMMTYMILKAFENVNLSTPGIYVRIHNDSPEDLKKAVARMLSKTKNLPGILNDDVLIPALYNSLLELNNISETSNLEEKNAEYQRIANDYCVDGCWEPIFNGISDWTFGMINGMQILQCALNRGATLDTNPGMLRGDKLSFISDEVTGYNDFKEIFKKHMQFFVDQSAFGLYEYYMLDEFVNPSPLFSAVLGTCMERGRDKSWGGTKYNIAGTILIGVPDMINTIAAIKKWVFDKKDDKDGYTLEEVLNAMRSDFKAPSVDEFALQNKYDKMKADFRLNSPKFGSNDPETSEIGNFIIETLKNAVMTSKKLADRVFLKSPEDLPQKEAIEILRLRRIAGYYGDSLQKKFGKDFNMIFTAGCGTFEQYPLQGLGIVASSDRNSGDPLTANFSPTPGTITHSIGHIFESLKSLAMNRLAAGAITDLCIDESLNDEDYILGILNKFITSMGNMMTLAIGNREEYQTIYELSVAASKITDKKAAYEKLEKYKDINVRVGGWQAPFISMSLAQQENYINRVLTK